MPAHRASLAHEALGWRSRAANPRARRARYYSSFCYYGYEDLRTRRYQSQSKRTCFGV